MEQTPLGHRQQQDHQQQPCRYYNTSRGCFRGDSCRYRHISTPGGAPKPASTQRNTPCRFYAAGGCNRGDSCFFKHDSEPSPLHTSGPSKEVSLPTASRIDKQEEIAYACVICFDEKPISYGLLEGCSHSFCLECIRAWRAERDKDHSVIMSGVIKTCPACRAPSSFITPSTKFYPSGHPMKIRTIEGYKANLAKIPCKYFARRRGPNRYCPFGRDCFYQHQNIDGTPYVFDHGTEEMRAAQQRRNARRARAADFAWFQDTLNSIADSLITSNFDAFMDSMGGLGDTDEDQDEDGDEDEDEDEDEVDEDEDEDDWDDGDEDMLQDALHDRWMSERALMEFFQRHSNGEASESGAECDEPAPPRRQSASGAGTPLAPTFVSASTVPRRQNRRWRR